MKQFLYRIIIYWWLVPILFIVICFMTWFDKDIAFSWKEAGKFFIDMWSIEK